MLAASVRLPIYPLASCRKFVRADEQMSGRDADTQQHRVHAVHAHMAVFIGAGQRQYRKYSKVSLARGRRARPIIAPFPVATTPAPRREERPGPAAARPRAPAPAPPAGPRRQRGPPAAVGRGPRVRVSLRARRRPSAAVPRPAFAGAPRRPPAAPGAATPDCSPRRGAALPRAAPASGCVHIPAWWTSTTRSSRAGLSQAYFSRVTDQ